jgi:hypothetical protein
MRPLRAIFARLSSRPFRNGCAMLIVSLVLISLTLRVQAYLFAKRVAQTDAILARFRVGETTRDTVLAQLPALHIDPADGDCRADECRALDFGSSRFTDAILRLFGTRWTAVGLYRLGLQYYSFDLKVKFSYGKVSSIYRSVWVETDAYYGGPARVVTDTESLNYPDNPSAFAPLDQPALILRHASNMPELMVHLEYGIETPQAVIDKAYSLDLRCVWRTSCHSWHQIAVDADREWVAEKQQNDALVHQPAYCPEQLIGRWAHAAKSIEFVEVQETSAIRAGDGGLDDTKVKLRRIGAPKGDPGPPIHEIHVPDRWYGAYENSFNPVLLLLQPGRQLIMFQHPEDDGESVLDPCQVIAATPTAREAVYAALKKAP